VACESRSNEGKLVGAAAGDRVEEAHGRRQNGGHFAQDQVAGLPACCLIDRSKIVNIEDRNGHFALLAVGPGEFELERTVEDSRIGEARQGIHGCGPFEPLGALDGQGREAGTIDRARR